MTFKVHNCNLYYGKYYVGYVNYIDYNDRGRHGYSISKISNNDLVKKFTDEADRLFPDSENPYIEFLDRLF